MKNISKNCARYLYTIITEQINATFIVINCRMIFIFLNKSIKTFNFNEVNLLIFLTQLNQINQINKMLFYFYQLLFYLFYSKSLIINIA